MEKFRKYTLPWPPSVNHYWFNSANGRRFIGKKGKEYREAVIGIASSTEEPLIGKLSVEIYVHFPDRRKRDIDNLLKAPLDALQHAGVYVEDSQIEELYIARQKEILKGGLMEIWIYYDE